MFIKIAMPQAETNNSNAMDKESLILIEPLAIGLNFFRIWALSEFRSSKSFMIQVEDAKNERLKKPRTDKVKKNGLKYNPDTKRGTNNNIFLSH